MVDPHPPPLDDTHKAAGRMLVVATALLWSVSGLFAKAPIFDEWRDEQVLGPLVAFWRALFSGLFLLPFIRRPRWRPALVPMTLAFATMNVSYLSAMALTTAANAIWLQSTAPLWVFVFGIVVWRTPASHRDLVPLALGAIGVATILAFELTREMKSSLGVAAGLAAGVAYAWVVMLLRHLRGQDAIWLVAVNNLVAAALLAPYVIWLNRWPTGTQLVVLALFGLVQMAFPYILFARALRTVSSQEATLIALLEPVLAPLWVYFAWGERPQPWTIAGAALILLGLVWRYGRESGEREEGRGERG